jgi:hypothetical protein
MMEYSEYISTQTNAMFTKIITGEMDINDFDKKYVKDVFENNGGPTIMAQVNAWYDSHDIDYDNVYALVK